MIGYTAGSTEARDILLAGSLDVNFHFLKNFEDEIHKRMKSPELNFVLYAWLLRNYFFIILQIITAYIFSLNSLII